MEIAPLLAMRGFPLSRSGGEMHWRIPGEESVSIRGNMWYSHYRGEGGDAISFARRFFHMDFKEAVRFLLEQSAVPAAGPVQCERQEQKQLRLPPKDSSEEQVRRYLTDIRKVSADVAGYFIETGQVYQSRAEGVRQGQEQCSLVLVGMDRDGAPRQAHIKGMRQRAFRYDAPGSDKAYGFRHMGGSGPLYVFEAAVDLMSYVSLYPEDWRQGNYLALNGTAETALFRTLEEYPEVRGVVLALDNDAGGIEGVMRLTGLLREKGYTDVSVQLPAWKDWNEELKARGGMDAVCAQPHPKLQMLEQVKDAVLARAVHAPRFVDGRYLEGTFQAACSAQADELQNSCLQKLAAGALLRARHLLCTGGETAGLDRLCFSTKIDAEKFCREKSAVFVVLPEEDSSKYFMVSLLVQQMYREILVVADGQGGALKNRVMFFLDELGSLPKIESLELMFSAARSRRLSIVGIIQSYGQLERNYGKEGCSIILDNAQDTIAGGFSPAGDTAEQVSRQLGEQTVMTGSVSRGKSDPSRSLQMMGRRLMTPDELKSMPKGQFIVMKTGRRPMLSKLRLFLDWGITFTEPYALEQHAQREVKYAGSKELRRKILKEYGIPPGQQIVPGQERFPERQKPGMIQENV